MANVTIDGKQYDSEKLSEEARGQLVSLQITDRKISDLQTELAIAQTARNAYARALGELLPKDDA
jgi:hypothetical protein